MSQSVSLQLANEPRSGCPINLFSELIGDRWSLVVIRDVMFADRSGFRELLAGCEEGIASNVLSARLDKLTASGLLSKHDDTRHKQRVHYRLTEASIQLVPPLVAVGVWASTWLPADPALAEPAQTLEAGGQSAMAAFMDDLRRRHLLAAGS
ncbi:winged helix-turn-helix transcriptional regulator [Euzebya tangerina]|nr:helix-turn-helix domain-containing protein [Euzebya tangerina]